MQKLVHGKKLWIFFGTTVDGSEMMEEMLYQLRLVVFPIIQQGFIHGSGGDRRISEPSTVL